MPSRTIFQTKRTSLVFVGASVCWGLGLDHTETYCSVIQSAIDDALGVPLGGWTARCVHADDIALGCSVATACFNADRNNEGPNYGTGTYSSGPYGNLNATSAASNFIAPGTSKLNYDGTMPTLASAGIFANYAGYRTPPGSTHGAFTAPMLRLNGAGQNIRFAANAPRYLDLGLIGQGSVEILGAWSSLPIVLGNGSTTRVTRYAVDLSPWGMPPSGPQAMSIRWRSGCVDVVTLWPNRQQATNHVAVQIMARNSYCLQDFTAENSDLVDPATGNAIPDLMIQSAIHRPASYESSPPIFVLFDSYNSMVTGAVGNIPDRRLDPKSYAAHLNRLGQALADQGSSVILTMPILPANWCSGPLTTSSEGSMGLAWLSGYGPDNYVDAIGSLASSRAWGFIDQSKIPSISTPGFFYPDGLHPAPLGAKIIAQLFIKQLGLPHVI